MKLYIVGAGPGDPELITVKGQKLLQEADAIFYTDSLVNDALLKQAKPEAEIFHTAGMYLEQIVQLMVERVKSGKKVVRLHTGDPSIYGATLEQMVQLKKEAIGVEIVPGVSSVFAAAAAAHAELTVPDLTQTVILTRAEGRTPVPEKEKLEELAKHHCTLALFLSATLTKKVTKALLEAGWSEETPIVVVYKATWPDQKIVRSTVGTLDEDMRANGIRKHALILAGWALDSAIAERSYRSKLYDRTFTHGYRQGEK
ncbi:precorrin-4 C(11)-methyltransferase [Anoxybacillus rupiensis]|jgi:precorrin-4/cobalt-precorrin-4 C11-methyltransferase|uniref:Precorrin-4 C(11)-methyltransferase n=1 Tax=Anoxybacteroides rupiense TaxID=311460 RepID=A0ABD5IUV1_9BACL|nr:MULTISPECIES: precorrin-4 C(11)-methyltransferase [Anoxybacillus]KXG09230.1 Cobalt-precorrin-4 C(11)-methyltransferase [Anoxybacillus sp. P3H1B]MBS2772390.1 precorrin-4 C(11)-methyltransferase [Anoxybacillus rupiensis]MDE8564057.1 precorrin-4 C(11)-methyltransferase [Anoxybacillus rupiensis]MED5051550.1 precorrin-4 C(11)-methyltransferase [Anoxybacillus rupiensis]OQM45835.1 precorrin-4 C(11)-methyltransferase [Anoxybacillus sp. UARK-01]